MPTSTHPINFICCPSVAHIVDLNIGTSCDHHPDIRESNVLAPVVCLNSSVVHISIGTVSQTSLTQVPSQSDAGSFATGHGCHGCLLRCHSLALTGRACHTPSSSWYPIFQSAFAFVVSAMILSRPLPLLVFLGLALVRQGGKEISSTKTW